MKIQYLTGLKICNGKERKIIRFKKLHIPFKTHKEIEHFIAHLNNRYKHQDKKAYLDLSENKTN